MQSLKVMVIGMGALIVVGLGLLGWGFYSRLASPAARGEQAAAAGHTPAPPAQHAGAGASPAAPGSGSGFGPGFGEARIELPAGCTLAEMRTDAGRVFVRTGPEGLCERILVLDPVTGSLLGSFVFRP